MSLAFLSTGCGAPANAVVESPSKGPTVKGTGVVLNGDLIFNGEEWHDYLSRSGGTPVYSHDRQHVAVLHFRMGRRAFLVSCFTKHGSGYMRFLREVGPPVDLTESEFGSTSAFSFEQAGGKWKLSIPKGGIYQVSERGLTRWAEP